MKVINVKNCGSCPYRFTYLKGIYGCEYDNTDRDIRDLTKIHANCPLQDLPIEEQIVDEAKAYSNKPDEQEAVIFGAGYALQYFMDIDE